MLTEQRKKELDILAQQANSAGDKYYFNMKQEVFNVSQHCFLSLKVCLLFWEKWILT